ncbi:YeeE/YedE family protein [Mycoplasmatota bacterium WC30]
MKTMSKRSKIEAIIGFALIALVLILGFAGAFSATVFVKCLIGLGFGYALTRGDFGFAGLSNRACRTGSTKLIRSLMIMFVVSAMIVGAFIVGGSNPSLWVNPISWGLLFGGILFGIGMAFSSCCATGVLQDVPLGFSRALITLVFFGIGVFLGFPLMSSKFVRSGVIGSDSGVYMVDWFSANGTNLAVGVVGALLVTILLAVLVGALAKWYEKKVAKNFPKQEAVVAEEKEVSVWNRFFVKKWSMTQTAIIIAILFGMLYAVTNTGWGASTVYGNWFGTILHRWFGVSLDSLANFTGWTIEKATSSFNTSLFKSAGYMQNVGIIVGAFVGLLLSGKFTTAFKAGLKIKPLEILLFVAGGLLLGFGTRLSLGCNVGALYTPIANFSLAGWFYFFFLFAGGYIGNMIRKAFYKKVDCTKIQ